ncbi:MAG: cation diffusion facilitator family transporter, partial [Candidatus Nanohaloarchaea archaeon]|nr:cation diffusion facilitator family transporter [Candidatus Nanohaloarchaea archaeon]
AVNVVSVLYLREEGGLSLNERGAFYHLMGDAGASVAVIIGLAVMAVTGMQLVDPLVAVLIALFVFVSAVRVLVEAAEIILQKAPIDPEEIKEVVEGIEGVEGAHDIKSWSVCSNVNVCTVHAEMSVRTLEEAEEVRKRVDRELKDRFNLQHVTLQIEQEPTEGNAVEH